MKWLPTGLSQRRCPGYMHVGPKRQLPMKTGDMCKHKVCFVMGLGLRASLLAASHGGENGVPRCKLCVDT